MLSIFLNFFVTVVLVIIVVAYFTLFERKVLAATQRRCGPNMVGFWGLLQPFADAIKLLAKKQNVVSGANYALFIISPMLLLASSLTL
jgi:NADH-quinone oxidoreductase subunit H